MKRTGVIAGAVLAGVLLLAAGPLRAADPGAKQNPGPVQLDFTSGMFGLAPGQVGRISAVNITKDPGPAQICQVAMDFLDADGVSVRPQPKVHPLDPGHSAFLDLAFDELPFGGAASRVMVRAVLRGTCQTLPGANQAPVPVRLTLEVFDAETGRASVMTSVEANPGPSQ